MPEELAPPDERPCDECPFIHPAQVNNSNADLIRMSMSAFPCSKNIEKRNYMARGQDGEYRPSHKYIRAGETKECAGKVYFVKNNERFRVK